MGELTKEEDAPVYSAISAKADIAIEEPKKRESKKAEVATPTAKPNLDAVLAAWGDEE
jgi:hypothetical protein